MKWPLLLIIFSINIYAFECDKFGITKNDLHDVEKLENLNEGVLAHYQQVNANEFDLVSDFALFKKAKSTARKIFWGLTKNSEKLDNYYQMLNDGKECARELFPALFGEEKIEFLVSQYQIRNKDIEIINLSPLSQSAKEVLIAKLKEKKIFIEGKKNPLKVDNFVGMIEQIILEGKEIGIELKAGTPHDWSPEFKKTDLYKRSVYSNFSKLLLALARGETSQFLLSGTENQLTNFILGQADESIFPQQMLKESYKLNNGDMYKTLLTIENVLNRYWRIPGREDLEITRKLAPIINTFGHNGDKFGTWYHLFGMILYGYTAGSLKAKTIGTIETIGSHILSNFENEKQENYINSKGGVIGGRLAKKIKKGKINNENYDVLRNEPSYYLDLDEEFKLHAFLD